jgi:serine/threonine-protein kinase
VATNDPADELVGRVLGARYRVDALIARGGMARVYRAHDTRLDRDVAVKVLSRPYADSPDFTRRFLGEARTAASLSHANLVHVYDSGATDGLHYMVMELLERYRSLRAVLAERGRLPLGEAVRLAREVLAGLEVVHAHGLVHADVKAGNVMIGPGPTKLIDFGIARGPRSVSDDGTSLGSLHAMSPEQLRGDALTPASDVFAVGVVVYQALTGRVPYPGEDPTEVAGEQQARRVPPPSSLAPGIGERLDRVVLQALAP